MATLAAAMTPTIHGYHLLRLLGEGGMGQVWLADDLTLGRRVAIKTIAAAHAGEGRARTRFLREARVMATVEHPHVVRVYAYGDAAGLAYFVMEFVDGETLAARLRRATGLAPDEALRITRQVALALASAWQREVVHRDVKPSNVLLDAESRVRVADFGLARAAPASCDDSVTYPGAVVGSPHYMSPEQARGPLVDFRSDIVLLGRGPLRDAGRRAAVRGPKPRGGVWHTTSTTPCPRSATSAPTSRRELRGPGRGHDRQGSRATARRPIGRSWTASKARRGSSAPSARPPFPTSTMPSQRRPATRRRVVASFATLVLATTVGAAWWARGRSAPTAPAGSLAVAAFYGPDEVSAKEGRMLSALLEAELARRMGESLRVVGVDETGPAVRSESAARSLAARLGVDAVVWGQSLSLGPRVEAQPWLTSARSSTALPLVTIESDAGRGAIERRRGAAQALADSVLVTTTRDALEVPPRTP